MSYGRDPDRKHRGVGAIAAVDGAGARRRRAQAKKLVVMKVIDARRAQLAHGPGRALPVPLSFGRISEVDTESGGGSAGSGGSGGAGGGGGGGGGGGIRPNRGMILPVTSTQLATNVMPTSVSVPTSTMTPTIPGAIVEPAPTSTGTGTSGTKPKAPYVPHAGSGGGTFTMPGQSVPSFQPPSEVEDLPPPPSSSGTGVSGKTLALVGGGIALLWLLTRKQE
jgi:hypothetical protein